MKQRVGAGKACVLKMRAKGREMATVEAGGVGGGREGLEEERCS